MVNNWGEFSWTVFPLWFVAGSGKSRLGESRPTHKPDGVKWPLCIFSEVINIGLGEFLRFCNIPFSFGVVKIGGLHETAPRKKCVSFRTLCFQFAAPTLCLVSSSKTPSLDIQAGTRPALHLIYQWPIVGSMTIEKTCQFSTSTLS